MARVSQKKVRDALEAYLKLKNPQFHLEKLESGKISGSVVSDTFRGLKDLKRQRLMWDALDKAFGGRPDDAVGTLFAYTHDEWNYADLLRRTRLERDVEEAGNSFCTNCGRRIGDEAEWIHRFLVGDPADAEPDQELYCDECVKIDRRRRFKGKSSPPAERN